MLSRRTTGSLWRRMLFIAAVWIGLLLAGGGYALDRVLGTAVTRNFDDQLEYVLNALILTSEIGPDGEVMFNREPADQRFLEPNSGLYWQVSARGHDPFPSRSLWDRQLAYGGVHDDREVHAYDSAQFPDEKLRITEASSAWMPAEVRSPSIEIKAAASVPAAKAARSLSLDRSSVSSRIETSGRSCRASLRRTATSVPRAAFAQKGSPALSGIVDSAI